MPCSSAALHVFPVLVEQGKEPRAPSSTVIAPGAVVTAAAAAAQQQLPVSMQVPQHCRQGQTAHAVHLSAWRGPRGGGGQRTLDSPANLQHLQPDLHRALMHCTL